MNGFNFMFVKNMSAKIVVLRAMLKLIIIVMTVL